MSKKIIIVDDSNTIRQHVKFALERCGYDVLEAVDGQDGLEKIKQNPDIVMAVIDINMPRMNGVELTKQIKSQVNPKLPIIILTTENCVALIEKAKAAGALAYMVKPFVPEQLSAVAKKVVGAP